MAESKNLAVSQILIKKGLLQIQTLELCMQIQKDLSEKGEKKSLEDILLQNKFIKEEDLIKAKNFLVLQKDVYIPNYQFLSKLGEGGMGSVYKGLQISLERPVAIKLLDPSLGRDKQFVKRFAQEAKLLAKLDHPNIVKGIDFGESEGYYYYVMEYLNGRNIAEIVYQDGILDEKVALDYTIQIAKALEHAKGKGLVHRDIKPENILVCEDDGRAKLCDLGLARWSKSNLSLTSQGTIVGTPYYLSPEQAQGQLEIDVRSDIYSLGATLYFMLAGKPPYEGEMSTVVHFRHIYDPPPVITTENDKVSTWLDDFFQEIMSKDINKRTQSPSDIISTIKEFQTGKRKSLKKLLKISKTPRPQKTPHPVNQTEKTSARNKKSSSGVRKKTMGMAKISSRKNKTLSMKQIVREDKTRPKTLTMQKIETEKKTKNSQKTHETRKAKIESKKTKPDIKRNLPKTSVFNKIEKKERRKTLSMQKIEDKEGRTSQSNPAYVKKINHKREKQKKIIIWSLFLIFFFAVLLMTILLMMQAK